MTHMISFPLLSANRRRERVSFAQHFDILPSSLWFRWGGWGVSLCGPELFMGFSICAWTVYTRRERGWVSESAGRVHEPAWSVFRRCGSTIDEWVAGPWRLDVIVLVSSWTPSGFSCMNVSDRIGIILLQTRRYN